MTLYRYHNYARLWHNAYDKLTIDSTVGARPYRYKFIANAMRASGPRLVVTAPITTKRLSLRTYVHNSRWPPVAPRPGQLHDIVSCFSGTSTCKLINTLAGVHAPTSSQLLQNFLVEGHRDGSTRGHEHHACSCALHECAYNGESTIRL